MHTTRAKKCFQENLNLFADPNTDPEKFNHYSGLLSLTLALENLEAELRAIKQHIFNPERRLQSP